MKPIDQSKVEAFLNALNQENPGLWIEMSGVNALTRIEPNDSSVIFYPNSGFPVKGFINTQTGEIKLITARRFSRD